MAIIYTPKGRAREYSPLAANLYEGCSHGCLYCYAPGIRRMTLDAYSSLSKPRSEILSKLATDCKSFRDSRDQVLLSFIGDPYCHEEEEQKITREALRLFLEYRIPVAVLTKGGFRVRRDIDIMKKFGRSIKVGATLTFHDPSLSLEWEPNAAPPFERIEGLRTIHENGIRTWASFEPVIDPDQSLRMIRASLDMVDEYRLGKLNHYRGIDEGIDWTAYLAQATALLRSKGKPFYVKQDLREAAPSIPLYGNEVLMDQYQAIPFEKDSGQLFSET